MKRLVEDSPLSGSEQRLSELLRQLEPTTKDPFRKRRIWASLMTARTRPPRRAPWTLRGLCIIALLGGGTAAAAALGGMGLGGVGLGGKVFGDEGLLGSWFGAAAPEEATERDERSQATLGPPAPLQPAATDEEDLAEDAPHALAELDPPSPSLESSDGEKAASAEAAPQERSRAKRPAEEKPSGEDPTPVLAAIRAWRSDGDAARAQRLLDGYLRENPRGALAEDALALSIEVASARKDPRAVSRAKRYLAAYPKGRFRSLAEKVAQGAP